jgi:hypothetical protein
MTPNTGPDPADELDRSQEEQSEDAGVPPEDRMPNAGGNMSEAQRSREPDLDDLIEKEHDAGSTRH